jgi:heat shock protein HtpX
MSGTIRTFLLLAALTAIFMAVGGAIGGQQGALVALAVAAAMNLWAWWGSDRAVLRMHNAQPLSPAEAPQLYAMVQGLAARAGIPMPALYLIHEAQPNAFATGRSPEHAAVAVNQGLLDLMDEREVAGVVAHELAHIKHRDTLILAVSATLAGAVGFLAQFGFMAGRGDGRRSNPLVGLLLAIFGPMAAMLVQMAVSRAREFEADAEGARICGDPQWLASGLSKLEGLKHRIANAGAEAHPNTAHMFIVNPLSGAGIAGFFATHPPTEERIARLMAMRDALPASMGVPSRRRGPWG